MENKPNVLIIMADHLRYDAVGKHTPNIMALAKDSITFNSAYTSCPLCAPARATFFSGKYPNENGSLINPGKTDDRFAYLSDDIKTLYHLVDKEWDSWHAGKQHLMSRTLENTDTHWLDHKAYHEFLKKDNKTIPGGDRFQGDVPEMSNGRATSIRKYSIPTTECYPDGFKYSMDGYIFSQCMQALKNRDKSKPLFLNAMYLAPHPPLHVPDPWYSMYSDVEMPENIGVWYENQSPLQLYNLTGHLGTQYSREEWQKIWNVYIGLVSMFDYCVGEMIRELKEQGIYDNTLIMLTSDHGDMLGSHKLWQKMCMYQESIHVPLIMKLPDSKQKGKQCNELVSFVDIMPTLSELLDITNVGYSGHSLMPLINEGKSIRDKLFIQYDGNCGRGNFQRAVIYKQHKLIIDIFKDEIYFELYNIVEDVYEKNNLAVLEEYRELTLMLTKEIKGFMKETNDMLCLSDDAYEQFIKLYTNHN